MGYIVQMYLTVAQTPVFQKYNELLHIGLRPVRSKTRGEDAEVEMLDVMTFLSDGGFPTSAAPPTSAIDASTPGGSDLNMGSGSSGNAAGAQGGFTTVYGI